MPVKVMCTTLVEYLESDNYSTSFFQRSFLSSSPGSNCPVLGWTPYVRMRLGGPTLTSSTEAGVP